MILRVPASVSQGRITRLIDYFEPFFADRRVKSVLDVGCGHGYVTQALHERVPHLEFTGVDVKVRTNTAIPVVAYDGETLPFENKSFDAVMLVDVLHHTDDPVVTLRECARVAREFVLIKDHIADSRFDHLRLSFLDWFGNRPFNIPMTYEYLSSREWAEAFDASGLEVVKQLRQIQTCPTPFYYPLDHDLHFIAQLTPRASSKFGRS